MSARLSSGDHPLHNKAFFFESFMRKTPDLSAVSTASKSHRYERLSRWVRTPLGRAFVEVESQVLDDMAEDLFGHHLLQMDALSQGGCTQGGQFRHRIGLGMVDPGVEPKRIRPEIDLFTDAAHLPVASESVAAAVLGHVLEFHDDPHQVLREFDRVLMPEGQILITGFSPVSLWGLQCKLGGRQLNVPWCGQFLALHRLKDWLSLLGFEVRATRRYFLRPAITQSQALKRFEFMEDWVAGPGQLLGASYAVLACKRTIPVTPIRPAWKTGRRLLGASAGSASPFAGGSRRIPPKHD